MVNLSSQPLAPEPPAAFPAPNQFTPRPTQGSADFSRGFGMRLESQVPASLGRENDAPAMDHVKQRKLEKKIRNALIGAILAGLVTLGAGVTGFIESYAIVDALLILALAYGIYRRSLASAIALIAYLVVNKVYIFLTVPEALSGGNLAVNGLLVAYLVDGAVAIRTLRSS